jgi:hypothetical protein
MDIDTEDFLQIQGTQEDRYEKLVGIGFAEQWQDMYQNLLEHKETKGHFLYVPKTLSLGRWLRR